MWAAQTKKPACGGPAVWKLISLLCSLNGPVPFWFSWIPDPPVQPGDSILPVASYQTPLDTVSLPFFIHSAIRCSFKLLPLLFLSSTPLLCLSSVVRSPAVDKYSPLMSTKMYSHVSHPAHKRRKEVKSDNFLWRFFFNKTEKGNKIKINIFSFVHKEIFKSYFQKNDWIYILYFSRLSQPYNSGSSGSKKIHNDVTYENVMVTAESSVSLKKIQLKKLD